MAETYKVILKSDKYIAKDGTVCRPYHAVDLPADEGAQLVKSGFAIPAENGQEIAKVEVSPDGKTFIKQHEITDPPKNVEEAFEASNKILQKEVDRVENKGGDTTHFAKPVNADEATDVDVANAVKQVKNYVPHVLHEVQVIPVGEVNPSVEGKSESKDEPEPEKEEKKPEPVLDMINGEVVERKPE